MERKSIAFSQIMFIPLLLLFLAPACKSTLATQIDKDLMSSNVNFDWLLGDWQRTNDPTDMQTFERWRKIDALSYEGLGFTVQYKDTVWQEQIKLHREGKTWYFDVHQAQVEMTRFKLKEIGSENFSCLNPTNDFPKLIEYHRDGSMLLARISGDDGQEAAFKFEPRAIFNTNNR